MIVRFRKCLLLLAIPILLFLFGTDVKALGLEATDFKVVGKNETIDVDEVIFSDNKVTSNITFNKLNDYVRFEFKLYNHDEDKYIIESITTNNVTDNLVIEYDYDTNEISKDKYATISLKFSYKNLLKNVEEINLNNLVLTITLTKENGQKETIIVNPITGDNLFSSILIFILSLSILFYCLNLLKVKRKYIYSLLVIVLISFPFIIFAKEKYEVKIYFNNITIKGEFDYFNVTIDKDNKEPIDIIRVRYGSEIGDIEVPSKNGYIFSHWVDENNNAVDKNTIVTSDLNIKALYNVVSYSITYNLNDGFAINPNQYNIKSNFRIFNPIKAGYAFVGWTKNDEEEKSIEVYIVPGTTGDMVLTAHYEPVDTGYLVYHYIEKLDGSYELKEQETLYDKTGTTVTANNKTYAGFTYDSDNTNNIKTGTVSGNGSLELKLYYKRNSYKVSYSYLGTIPQGASELPGEQNYQYEENVTIAPNASAHGYTFSGWNRENFTMPAEDVILTGTFIANGDTPYKIEHYQENADDDGYTLKDTDNLTGETNANVTANPKSYEGFNYDGTVSGTIDHGTIDADGNLTLKLYYKRKTFNVTYSYTGYVPNGASELPPVREVKYGSSVTIAPNATAPGYTFSGWSISNFMMPNEAVSITGSFDANNINYKVNHYIEGLDNSWTLKDTDNLTGKTNSIVTASAKGYTGFLLDTSVSGTIQSGTLSADEELVLKLYYKRQSYDVIYSYTGTIPEGASALPLTVSHKYEESVTIAGPATAPGYEFNGWDREAFTMPAEDVYITGSFRVGTANYKIEHYTEKLDGSWKLEGEETITGPTESEVTATNKTYTGFTFDSNNDNNIKTGIIKGNNSLVLKLYYTRNSYNVTYSYTGTIPVGASALPSTISHKYEGSVTVANPATAPGYNFSGWSTGNFNMPAEDVTITGSFEAVNSTYTIEYYYQNYGLYENTPTSTSQRSGLTDTIANVTEEDKTNIPTRYTFDENNSNNILSGTITGNNSLVLKLYFKEQFSVTYKPGTKGSFAETTISNLDYNANTPAPPEGTCVEGYDFNGWNPPISPIVTTETVYTAICTPISNTPYKVEHYSENLDGTWNLEYTDYKHGITDTIAQGESITIYGFDYDDNNSNNVKSGRILGDGSLVLKLYYSRNEYKLSYSYTGTVPEGASALPAFQWIKHGLTVNLANKATAPGYTFHGWLKDDIIIESLQMPLSDVIVTGSFAYATNTPYKVEHYGQDVNGNYVLMRTENKTGTTNASVTASEMNVDHYIYTYNPLHPNQVKTGRIKADGTLTLKMYYSRNKYDLHLINESNVDGATSGEYFYGTQFTLTAHDRDEYDEPFTRWSDGSEEKTISFTLTEDKNIGPYYHIYTVTLVDKDPRTTVAGAQTRTQTLKVDRGDSVNLPTLTREDCRIPRTSPTDDLDEHGCTFVAEFDGWFLDEEFTQPVTSPYTPSGDTTLYAKWNGVYYHYRESSVRTYSGTQGDYDDSGIVLYNSENRERDYNISFDILEIGVSSFAQPTIMNAKYEKSSLNYPGYVVRFNTGTFTRIQLTGKWNSDYTKWIYHDNSVYNEPATAAATTTPIHFEFHRRDGVVTYIVTGIGKDGVPIHETGTIFTQHNDSYELPDEIPTTVTFGSTIDEHGIPMRFFRGKLANMEVKIASNLYSPLQN